MINIEKEKKAMCRPGLLGFRDPARWRHGATFCRLIFGLCGFAPWLVSSTAGATRLPLVPARL
jgi:hypothetical protein